MDLQHAHLGTGKFCMHNICAACTAYVPASWGSHRIFAVRTHARVPDLGMSQLWMDDGLAGCSVSTLQGKVDFT